MCYFRAQMTDIRPMTPAESREALLTLPLTADQRLLVIRMLQGADDNGFMRGAGKLPRSPTPFDSLIPPPTEPPEGNPRRKRR